MIYLENVYHVIHQTMARYDRVLFITRDASKVQGFLDAHGQVELRGTWRKMPRGLRFCRN